MWRSRQELIQSLRCTKCENEKHCRLDHRTLNKMVVCRYGDFDELQSLTPNQAPVVRGCQRGGDPLNLTQLDSWYALHQLSLRCEIEGSSWKNQSAAKVQYKCA